MTINSKLTEEDIIRVYTGTESRQEAAELFNIHTTSVDRIRAGKWHTKITKNYPVPECVKVERMMNSLQSRGRVPFSANKPVEPLPVRDVLPDLWGGRFTWLKDNPYNKPTYKKAKGTCYGTS